VVELNIQSFNVKGLKEFEKRSEIFSWINKKQPNILLLQETHSNKNKEENWYTSWGNRNMFFSHGGTRAKGVCTCFKGNINFKLHKQKSDRDGRVLILDTEINNTRITIVNIYAPNEDIPTFFEDVFIMLENFDNEHIIFGGDLNLVFDLKMDKKGGKATTHFKCRNILSDYMDKKGLIDIWRRDHPTMKAYTWKSYKKPFVHCRLDYLLTTYNMSKEIAKSTIHMGFRSDHNLIEIRFKKTDDKRGPGFWKLNCALLENQRYIETINKCIENCDIDNPDTSSSLLWDTMKCRVRGASVKFSARLKRERNVRTKELEEEILSLDKLIENDTNVDYNVNEVQRLKYELEGIVKNERKGAEIRSKSQYYEYGEKSTKYFYSLEKSNAEKKHIKILEKDNGECIVDTFEILEEEVNFYENLYKSNVNNMTSTDVGNAYNMFLNDEELYKDVEIEDIDIKFEESVLKEIVDSFSLGKSPGSDGLPIEFYQTFWTKISKYLINSYNDVINNGYLGFSQKQGVISLIPKKGKDPKKLKNWRPITLLNIDYKILTKYIAEYLKTYLCDLIHTNQKGFLSNRYIGENIQNATSAVNYCEKNNLDALLIFLDFNKAFDCVEWNLIDKALKMFGFKDNLRYLVKCIYSENMSCIVNNGNISRYFKLHRGLRQGCPLSPYLFILVVELLANAVRKNNDIVGIRINDVICKLNQYADDTFFITMNDYDCVKAIFDIINKFSVISGLTLNLDKTEVLHIGNKKVTNIIEPAWLKSEVNLLGIKISKRNLKSPDHNFEGKLDKIESCLKIWQHRNLSLIGRIQIIKSLASSQLVYLWSTIPSPTEYFFKILEEKIFKFLWNSSVERIKRQTITAPYNMGGLKMVDCRKQNKALKAKWLSNIFQQQLLTQHDLWYAWLKNSLPLVNIDYLLKCNINTADLHQVIKLPRDNFWFEVFACWCEINYNQFLFKDGEVRQQCLWFNSLIKCKGKLFFFQQWYNKGIETVNDLIVQNRWIRYTELTSKTGLKINFLDLLSLIKCIPDDWKNNITNDDYEMCEYNIDTKVLTCKALYNDLLVANAELPDKYPHFWHNVLELDIDVLEWYENYEDVFKWTISSKLRSFFYQLRMGDIMSNYKLFKMKKRDNSQCDWCKETKQDIVHLFWECKCITNLWNKLSLWVSKHLDCDLKIEKELVFMYDIEAGNLTKIINLIVLTCCRYVYVQKCVNMIPTINGVINFILSVENIEKGIAIRNNKFHLHCRKWGKISKINE